MLMVEPPRSPYDLHFSVAGIPVRVHPWFWLISLLLGMGLRDPKLVMIWMGLMFVSILVHELGHAIAARAQGWDVWITLYGMGGLASYRPSFHRPWTQIMIAFAGPLAGFILAAVVVTGVIISGHSVEFSATRVHPDLHWTFGSGPPLWHRNAIADIAVELALLINIFWGLVNLLPVLPLDGGQISRELLIMANPRDGHRQALMLSVFTGGALSIFAIVRLNDFFLAIFFGWIAYNSFQSLQSGGGGGFGGYSSGRWR